MMVPFIFWTHPATGRRSIYIGHAAIACRKGRYIVPVPRRFPFDC